MSLQTVVRSALVGNTDVAAAVGDRVHPLRLPQNPQYPALTTRRVSQGGKRGNSDVHRARYQITAYTKDYGDTEALAGHVVTALGRLTVMDVSPSIAGSRWANTVEFYSDVDELYIMAVDIEFYLCN